MSRGTYIVVAHLADGEQVTEHATKTAAHLAGMALRRLGIDAFAYSVADAQRLGLDPRRVA